MSEFYPYPNYSRCKKRAVVQSGVVHSRKLQFRLSGDSLKQFDGHKYYSPQRDNESEFIKILIKEALDKREAESWAKEVEEMFESKN